MSPITGLLRYSNIRPMFIRDPSISSSSIARWLSFRVEGFVTTIMRLFVLYTKQLFKLIQNIQIDRNALIAVIVTPAVRTGFFNIF